MIYIAVHPEPFDAAQIEQRLLAGRHDIGAVVSFKGCVRDFSEASNVTALTLEHYPGMTEQMLTELAEQASERWSLSGVALVHRVGKLAAGDGIVLVMTAAAHRRDAFAACEFLIDRLKTAAPFWKKEHVGDTAHWVAERHSDLDASRRWEE
ncbi:molybdenum cofactor biosynthesis protein MoaE [Carnimonas nigrificans]|uniref:molybdenum cofactor biosynthesis protein MoaE n=1 Tax=Carnimonas nigrificans TaxID=64323 RepID=UPI00047181CC|nr:molybdenum cofactor biosynthesis protein MoaE [Carnimonas nigrificans]